MQATVYTKPSSLTLKQTPAADTDMLEFFCIENNRDMPHMVGK